MLRDESRDHDVLQLKSEVEDTKMSRYRVDSVHMKTTRLSENSVLDQKSVSKRRTSIFSNISKDVFTVPILITSMGGSGTTFLANVFKSAGIEVLHEAVGKHGTVGWWQLFNQNQLRWWQYHMDI